MSVKNDLVQGPGKDQDVFDAALPLCPPLFPAPPHLYTLGFQPLPLLSGRRVCYSLAAGHRLGLDFIIGSPLYFPLIPLPAEYPLFFLLILFLRDPLFFKQVLAACPVFVDFEELVICPFSGLPLSPIFPPDQFVGFLSGIFLSVAWQPDSMHR